MRHGYLLTTALLYAASIICAAEKKEATGLTFYCQTPTLVGEAALIIKHHIKPEEKESVTSKTFQELFNTNACVKNIPWIMLATLSLNHKNFSTRYFDMIELVKQQIDDNKISNPLSWQEIDLLTSQSLEKIYPNHLHQGHPVHGVLHIIYYTEKNNMKRKCPNSHLSRFSFLDKKTGKKIVVTDIKCAYKIYFNDDYSDLIPLIYKYQTQAPCEHFDELTNLIIGGKQTLPTKEWYEQRLSFWERTLDALPKEQQNLLIKEANERFEFGVAFDS